MSLSDNKFKSASIGEQFKLLTMIWSN